MQADTTGNKQAAAEAVVVGGMEVQGAPGWWDNEPLSSGTTLNGPRAGPWPIN